MDTQTWLASTATFDGWSKPQLVDYLIEHGTIYPTRPGMLRWSKDDLVRAAADITPRHLLARDGAA